MPTILITGFGPFPGAPHNPTIALVEQLAALQRPALDGVTLVGHVFETSYASVDRDLPTLLKQHQPDALLMFGLAAATPFIRVETWAQNALTVLPDAAGTIRHGGAIAGDEPAARKMPSPHRALLAAARSAGVRARLSRDAGRYLCNYLCWRATANGGPKRAAFVHVPLVRADGRVTENKLRRVGIRVLLAMAAEIATGVNPA